MDQLVKCRPSKSEVFLFFLKYFLSDHWVHENPHAHKTHPRVQSFTRPMPQTSKPQNGDILQNIITIKLMGTPLMTLLSVVYLDISKQVFHSNFFCLLGSNFTCHMLKGFGCRRSILVSIEDF